ncbi:DUF134 domain-containing protein [candidate division WOR-3 bacterium]|nr:DUF134 domain-containing protein [candidate division WOR-3 bacterium]
MPRPRRCRWVLAEPRVMCFKPRGLPMRSLDRVVLTFDEVEALRLADCEGWYQERSADSMKVSRPTFGRILAAARGKVADALLHGKALVFETGASVQRLVRLRCPGCGFEWEMDADEEVNNCPACGRAVKAIDTEVRG